MDQSELKISLQEVRRFWRDCVVIAARGNSNFANDWQWLIGYPLTAGLLWVTGYFYAEFSGKFEVTLTTGALGVLAAAALAYGLTWLARFIGRLLKSPAALYYQEKKRADNFTEIIRQKLKCSFNMNDPGCVRPNTSLKFAVRDFFGLAQSSSTSATVVGYGFDVPTTLNPTMHTTITPATIEKKGTYYRIRVNADCIGSVENCQGRLLSLKRGTSSLIDGETIVLPFAKAEDADATSKTIHGGVSEFLDFMFIEYEKNQVTITAHKFSGSSSINWNDLFSLAGTYNLHIAVISSQPMTTIDLAFHWTLNHSTSRIECLAVNT